VVDRLNRVVHVYPDPASAARAAAERLVRLSDAAVERGRPFALALSGGRTPEPLYRALGSWPDGARRWPSWQLFWCDERCVPQDDPRSNAGLARRLWLGPCRFPEENVHPVDTAVPMEEAAQRYERLLRTALVGTGATFDAVVLGVGADGHTASLYPGAAALRATGRWVVGEPSPSQPPDVPRVTLTLEGIGRARTAVFLVTGRDKRPALRRILLPPEPGADALRLPAAQVTALEGVEWFVDRDAAPPGVPVGGPPSGS